MISTFKNKLDSHMLEIVKGASMAFILKAMGAVFAFGFNVMLSRMLGPEGAGIYFLALTCITIVGLFGRLGLDNALLRYIASNASVGNWSAVKGISQKGIKIAFGASFFVALVVFLAAPYVAVHVFLKPELARPLRWMSLSIVPFTLLTLYSEMLKGLKLIMRSQLIQGVGIPALSFVGLFLLGPSMGVNGAVLAYSAAATITAVGGLWLWMSATPQLRGVEGHFKTKPLLDSSFPMLWAWLMNMLMTWTATFMVGIWCTNYELGIFSISTRTAMLTNIIMASVSSIVAPKFAELYRLGDMEALCSTARKSATVMLVLASPMLLAFLLAPRLVMGIFGSEFTDGAMMLQVLTVSQFINVVSGSAGYLLMMSGNEKSLRNIFFIAALINVVLTYVFIQYFGVIGAAFSSAVSLIILNLMTLQQIWARLRIRAVPFPWKAGF